MIQIDLTTIIVTLISSIVGTGAIITGLNFIIFRKQNKTIKTNEAETSNLDVEAKKTENDDAQIDLGKKYIQASVEIVDMMKKNSMEMNDFYENQNKKLNEFYEMQNKKFGEFEKKLDDVHKDIDTINTKVSDIDERTSRIEQEQSIHGAFLNGELTKFKAEHQELMKMQSNTRK